MFHDDAAGSKLQRFNHVRIAHFGREQQRPDRKRQRREIPERFQTGLDRHHEIEQQDIGSQLAHQLDGFTTVVRFADNLKSWIALE